MSSHTHRKPYNSQGITGAHGPVLNQPVAGPENPHGNSSVRHHEKYVRRSNRQRRQDHPEPTTAPRPDFPGPGLDQPAIGTHIPLPGPAPAEDPALPMQTTTQNDSPDANTLPNITQPVMLLLKGRAEEDMDKEDVDEGYDADDERSPVQGNCHVGKLMK